MLLSIIQVQSIGKIKSLAFVDGPGIHELREVEVDEYLEPCAHAKLFKETRRELRVTIRQACERMNLKGSILCGLENGRYTLSEEDWAIAIKAIGEVHNKK